jgi:hypothetical protein
MCCTYQIYHMNTYKCKREDITQYLFHIKNFRLEKVNKQILLMLRVIEVRLKGQYRYCTCYTFALFILRRVTLKE